MRYNEIIHELSAGIADNMRARLIFLRKGVEISTALQDEVAVKIIKECSKEKPCEQTIALLTDVYAANVALELNIVKNRNRI